MKRLLIALVAAVAVSTGFAKLTQIEGFEGSSVPGAFKPSAQNEDESELVAYDNDGRPSITAPYNFSGFGNQYLALDTGNATLWCTNSGAATYFDMVMQFNPSATAPTPESDTKIAVYVNSSSNLVVLADGGPYVTTSSLNPGTWGRLTISAVTDGFQVRLNGTLVKTSNDVSTFPSLTGDATINSIGFNGSGKLDDFVARTTDPFSHPVNYVAKVGGDDGEYYETFAAALADGQTSVTFNGNPFHTADGEAYDAETNPYVIANVEDLLALMYAVKNGTEQGNTYVQTADIDMSSISAFPGIGESGDDVAAGIAFTGVYNGNDHTISNVTLAENEYAGIFRKVYGTVKNLTVNNMGFGATPSSDKSYGCAIVGEADNNAVLQNLVAEGTFCGEGNAGARHNTAGIVCVVQTATGNGTVTIASCTNNATIYGRHHRVGGILAYTRNQGSVNVSNCVNNGELVWTSKTTPADPRGIAGIVACPEGSGAVTITDCANTGSFTVNGAGEQANVDAATGDIVGYFYGKDSSGTFVENGGNTYRAAGNLVGTIAGTVTVTKCPYAIASTVDAVDYLTTVKADGLAAGNTYVLQQDVAASETPVYTLAAANDYIAFNTNGFNFAGTVAAGTGLGVAAKVSDTTITYSAGIAAVDNVAYPTFAAAVAALALEGATDDYVTLLANVPQTYVLSSGDTSKTLTVKTNGFSVDVTKRDVDVLGYSSEDGFDTYVSSRRVAYITKNDATTNYASLQAAFDAAVDGDTVMLDADDISYNVALSPGVTFNTNGKTYSGTVTAANPNLYDINAETVDAATIYTVVGGTAVASITKDEVKTEYNTIAKALAAAAANDTVVLEADFDENVLLPTGVSFVTTGHTYSGTVSAAAGNGYVAVENNGVWAIVDNTASTWIGDEDDFWATASNWSTGLVPGQYTTVTFPNAGRIRFAEGNGSVNVGAMVVSANVTFSENSVNYSYYPFINVCGGSISGTGTMTLERCGLKGNGTTLTVGCQVVFAGDSPTTHDCFLQNGPIVFNSTVSSTTGRLHVQTPVTFNGAVNLTNATINSAFTGVAAPIFNGAVTLENGASILSYAVTYNDALTIGEGAVVSVGSASQTYGENFVMTGSGRFIGDTQLPAGKAQTALQQSTWTGTLELKGMTIKTAWSLTAYGNANSKICFNNVTTYLRTDNNAVGGVEIAAGGLKVNGNYSSGNWTLPELSGVGTFTVGTAGNNNKNFYFPADSSKFSGSIVFAEDTANTRVVFGTTDREFKEKTICVGSNATVGAGASWVAVDEIYLDGVVYASAATSLSTVVGSGKIVYGAKPTGTHTFGEGWDGIGALDYKGTERIDLADYVNTIAQKCICDTVEIVESCTMSGDNYFGADVTPALKVSGFVLVNDGSSSTKRVVSRVTGDGVLVFGTKGGMVNYAIDNVVGWNGVITNSASATLITNIVSGAGTVYSSVTATAPAFGSNWKGTYAIGYSLSGTAEEKAAVDIDAYGVEGSTVKLSTNADNVYLAKNSAPPTISATLMLDATMTIKDGWSRAGASEMITTIGTLSATENGALVLAATPGDTSQGAMFNFALPAIKDYAGTITVGQYYRVTIGSVYVEAEPAEGAVILPMTVAKGAVLGGDLKLYVGGEDSGETLVYDAEKGGLVLYVPPAQVTIDIPTVANTTPSVTANGEPVEIVNGQITVADGAAIVLTYTSTTHEVTNGTIGFTATAGYTVDVSGVTTAAYVAKIDGGASYTTLQAAFDAAANSQKIVLLADEVAGVTLPSVGKMVYFYAGSFTSGEIADAEGNFITTVTDETTSIGGEDVMAKKYRVEAAFMAVTINDTRTLYGGGSYNDAFTAANAGPLGTTVEFFSGDPASYAASLPMFTYNEQTGIYTKTLEPVAAVYSGVQQLSVHTSLADAIAAAEDGLTVKLLADASMPSVEFGEKYGVNCAQGDSEIVINKAITLDGNGHTIYGLSNYFTHEMSDGCHDIFISGSKNVTIKNVTLSDFGGSAYVSKFTYPIWAGQGYTGTLVLDNVTVTNFNRTAFNFNGGTVVVTNCTVVGDAPTPRNTNGAYFQNGIGVLNANVTVFDSTFSGIGAYDPDNADSNAAECFQLMGNGATSGTGSITVNGGSYSGQYVAIVADNATGTIALNGGDFVGTLDVEEGSTGSIVVSGGTFDRQVPAAYCASGKVPTTTPDAQGKYTVVDYVPPSGIDPTSDAGAPIAVDTTKTPEEQAADAQAAAAAMDVQKTADATSVDQATWNGYFTKTAEKVNDAWVAKAELNPAVVLPVDGAEETPLTDMLESVAATAIDATGETKASVPTKAGLYYWIEGATEVGAASYTPGTAVLGNGGTQSLTRPPLTGENGKAFFKVCVGVAAPPKD